MKKSTLVLLAVVTAAVVGLVLWERKRDPEEDRPLPPVELFTFSSVDVRKVEWKRGGEHIVVERGADETWRMTSPEAFPASTAVMLGVIQVLDQSPVVQRVPKDLQKDSKAWGLDPPRYEITFHATENRSLTIAFGNDVGAGQRVYARASNAEGPLFVDMYMRDALQRTPAQLRDAGIARFAPRSLRALAVTAGGETTSVRLSGSAWKIEKPVEDIADAPVIQAWASELAGLEGSGWSKADPSRDYGFASPYAILEVSLDPAKTITVKVGAEDEGVRRWVTSSEYPGEVATISLSRLNPALEGRKNLPSTQALPLPLDQVTWISYGGVELKKDATGWKLLSLPIRNFKPSRVDMLLGHLSNAAALQRPAADIPPPADAIAVTLGFGPDAATRHTARFWALDDVMAYIRLDDPARIAVTRTQVLFALQAGAGWFQDEVVMKMVALAMRRVVVERDGIEIYTLERAGPKIDLAAPVAGKELDPRKAAALIQVVADARAETWVKGKPDDPAFGLAAPAWRVRLIPHANVTDAVERVLRIGAVGPGGLRYAQVEGDDQVFLLQPSVMGILEAGVWKE